MHAYAAMAAIKLLGRFPDAQRSTLLATLQRCTTHMDVEVQQRSCEVHEVLKLKDAVPVRPCGHPPCACSAARQASASAQGLDDCGARTRFCLIGLYLGQSPLIVDLFASSPGTEPGPILGHGSV